MDQNRSTNNKYLQTNHLTLEKNQHKFKLAILAQAWLHDDGFSINGTVVQLHNLAIAFVKKGIEVSYIAYSSKHQIYSSSEDNGIIFHWIPYNKKLMGWKKSMKNYQEVLNKIQPNAIYVRGRNPLQYVAGKYALKHGIRYVWGTNGLDSAEFFKNLKRLQLANKSFIRKLVLFPLKYWEDLYINKGMKMAKVIVNQSLQQQASTKKILGINGIVLPSYFLPQEYQIDKEPIIIWLATLSENKQPKIFIRLIESLRMHHWRAVLGGGTKSTVYEKEIKMLAEDKVDLKGTIPFDGSNHYYARAKIYVNTSKAHAEGLPNAYIQSWLNGTIVLSLHHDPNDWMKNHGIGFCANGDFEALVSKTQELIDQPDLLNEMSQKAKAFAEKTFSNPEIIQAYLNLFYGNH